MRALRLSAPAGGALARALLCVAAAGVVACAEAPPLKVTPYERPDDEGEDPGSTPRLRITTLLDTPGVLLGGAARVRCRLSHVDGTPASPRPTTVVVTPATSVTMDGEVATFVPPTPGIYHAACRTADGTVVDGVGVDVMVQSRLAATWQLHPPTRTCYGPADRLELDYDVYDVDGAPVANVPVSVAVTPATGWVGNGTTGLRFLEDGTYQVRVEVAGPRDPAANLPPATFSVVVDATAPVIELTSPTRGEMIVSGGMDQTWVQVTGTARDEASPIRRLVIGGVEQSVAGDRTAEPVSTQIASRWGLSIVTGRAEDACGNVGYLAIPFLRSGAYYAASTFPNTGARVHEALHAQVSQSFIDDHQRADLDDLVTLAHTALSSFDFNGMLAPGALLAAADFSKTCTGSPLQNYAEVAYNAIRHPDPGRRFVFEPYVEHLTFHAGAVGFDLGIEQLDFPIRVYATVVQCAAGIPTVDYLTLDASVGVDRLAAAGVVGVDLYQGRASAEVIYLDLAVEGAYLDIECGSFDWACDTIAGALVGAVESLASGRVDSAAREVVPSVVEEGLGSLSVERTITLPAPLSMGLNVSAGLDRLTFCGSSVGLPVPASCGPDNTNPGSAGLSLWTQIAPIARGASIPASARGAVASAGDTPRFDSSRTSFGVALRRDALNQLMWALWYGGALDLPDLGPVLEQRAAEAAPGEEPMTLPDGVEVGLYVGLPPVLMLGDEGETMELGLGDLQVTAAVDAGALLGNGDPFVIEANLTVNLLMAVDVAYEAGTVRIVPDAAPVITFEIHAINDLGYAQLLGERLGALVGEALGGILGDVSASFALPTFDLSAVPGVAPGTRWGLQSAEIVGTDAYVSMSGAVGPVP